MNSDYVLSARDAHILARREIAQSAIKDRNTYEGMRRENELARSILRFDRDDRAARATASRHHAMAWVLAILSTISIAYIYLA